MNNGDPMASPTKFAGRNPSRVERLPQERKERELRKINSEYIITPRRRRARPGDLLPASTFRLSEGFDRSTDGKQLKQRQRFLVPRHQHRPQQLVTWREGGGSEVDRPDEKGQKAFT